MRRSSPEAIREWNREAATYGPTTQKEWEAEMDGLEDVYDFPLSSTPAPTPANQGMTDAEIDAAWDAHLRHLAHDDE